MSVPEASFDQRDEVVRLQTNLLPVQATLSVINTPAPEIQELLDELAQTEASASEIEQALVSLQGRYADWPAMLSAVGNYDPARLSLTSLAHADNRITLNGRAIDDSTVVGYAQALEASQLFERVVIQSVRSIATPFATPTIVGTASPQTTLTPGGDATPPITSTLSANIQDEYETDDFAHQDIILGQPQRHNFNPIYDVDQVKFLAKKGRFYRVSTFDLTPGVDTFMTVSVAGAVYTNDDAQPGQLSSEVVFQVGPASDVQALVKLTNRGQYGPDMWYQVAVEEVIPTPTPTLTPTSEPTPTGTSAPTATPSPSPVPANTPTATPDLRDVYEPDDAAPKPIAVGETQTHNFFPAGDVDKVTFNTKAGRQYLALTSNLALGVDTFMEVALGDQRWQNDDYDLPGTGNFASAVCFPALVDSAATVTISNRNQQYAPDKRYDVGVSEAPALAVTPLTLSFGPVTAGGADPAPQQISVASVGDGILTWEARTDSGWLAIIPASGTAPSSVQVLVDIDNLPPESYTGDVVIASTALCAANTPQTVTVSLQVVAPAARAPGIASRMRNGEAVEFVIVLELKVASP